MIVTHPSVYLEINTYVDLIKRAEFVATWVDSTHKHIVSPLMRRLLSPQAKNYWIGLYAAPLRGVRNAIYDYNDKNWNLLLEELHTGKLRQFSLRYKTLNSEGYPELDYLDLIVDLSGLEYQDRAHRLILSVTRPLYGADFTPMVQQHWVEIAKSGAISLDAATGYMTLDNAGALSPYENSIGLDYMQAAREFRSRLRGYYWGNVLSQKHIESLGGMEQIRQDAPCYAIEDWSDGQGTKVYLQLTPSLDDFSDETLGRLKQYLEPLLPQGNPRDPGVLLRVL